jgi:hypothetical protein
MNLELLQTDTVDEPDDSDTNIIIFEDRDTPLYGHSLVKNIKQFSDHRKVTVITGVSYGCYISYLLINFAGCKEVQEAWRAFASDGTCRYNLLEAIDDNVELTYGDVLGMGFLEQEKEALKQAKRRPKGKKRK